jgi:hypothetical protein
MWPMRPFLFHSISQPSAQPFRHLLKDCFNWSLQLTVFYGLFPLTRNWRSYYHSCTMVGKDSNLKLLGAKVRAAAELIRELRAGRGTAAGSPSGSWDDLPLLRKTGAPDNDKLGFYLRERAEIRQRVRRILDELEKVME